MAHQLSARPDRAAAAPTTSGAEGGETVLTGGTGGGGSIGKVSSTFTSDAPGAPIPCITSRPAFFAETACGLSG